MSGVLKPGRNGLPVFYDPSGWRRIIVNVMQVLVGLFGVVILGSVILTSMFGPKLPQVVRNQATRNLTGTGLDYISGGPHLLFQPAAAKLNSGETVASKITRYGFLVNWDENSFSSLKAHANDLDVAVVEWLHLGTDGIIVQDDPRKQQAVRGWVGQNAPKLALLPLVKEPLNNPSIMAH